MCLGVELHHGCMQDFTALMQSVGWNQCRMAYLYGTFDKEQKKVTVEALYEPPQEVSPDSFQLLEDPREDQVNTLVHLLGMKKVGWIFAHPPREEGFLMSANEVMFAAFQQLEAADGVHMTPFVSIRMSPDETGSSSVDALQVCV
jgi:nuclear protein localization protein 4 homolog